MKTQVVVLLSSIVLQGFSYANQDLEINTSTLKSEQGWADLKAYDKLNIQAGLSFGSYFSAQTEYFESTQASSTNLDLLFDGQYKWNGLLDGELHIVNQYSFIEEYNYFMPQNIFGNFNSQNFNLSVGRKKQNWSRADEMFHRGLIEGRYTQNKLRPIEYGLTGLFLERDKDSHRALLFASPVYIPEFGPYFKSSQGRFLSKNPYFNNPPEKVIFFDQETPVTYNLIKPDERELIFQESYGFLYEFTKNNYFFRTSYLNKPMNQLILGGRVNMIHSDSANQELQVDVHVVPQRHEVTEVEIGKNWINKWSWWLSSIWETPEKISVPTEWILQNSQYAQITTGFIGYQLNNSNNINTPFIYLSASYVNGGDAKERTEFDIDKTLFEGRYQYNQIFQLGIKQLQSRLINKPLHFSIDWAYESLQEGGYLLSNLDWDLSKDSKIWMTLDMLGLFEEKSISEKQEFLSNYRVNDKIQMGFTYVF